MSELLNVWRWMSDIFPESHLVIAGGFNSPPSDSAWQKLRSIGLEPAIKFGASTLIKADDKFSNLYDDFWYNSSDFEITHSGVINYPKMLGVIHDIARSVVLDHAPIIFTTGEAVPRFTNISH